MKKFILSLLTFVFVSPALADIECHGRVGWPDQNGESVPLTKSPLAPGHSMLVGKINEVSFVVYVDTRDDQKGQILDMSIWKGKTSLGRSLVKKFDGDETFFSFSDPTLQKDLVIGCSGIANLAP